MICETGGSLEIKVRLKRLALRGSGGSSLALHGTGCPPQPLWIYARSTGSLFISQPYLPRPRPLSLSLLSLSRRQVGAPNGFQSRSLKAAYYLRRAGFSKVSYMQGGLSRWIREDLPLEAVVKDQI